MSNLDKLGVEIEIGDLVVVGSNSRVRIGKVYKFNVHGTPLVEPLVAETGCKKGLLGYAFIVLKKGNGASTEALTELMNYV